MPPPPFFLMKMSISVYIHVFIQFSKDFPLLRRNLIKNFSTPLVLISPIAFLPNLNWQTDLLNAQYECKWKLNWNEVWKMNSKTWLDTACGEPHERHNSVTFSFKCPSIYCIHMSNRFWIPKSIAELLNQNWQTNLFRMLQFFSL